MSDELNLSSISYTNKDFQEAYPELLQLAKELSYKWDPTISNEGDPGVVLIKELALAIDKINYNSDKNALENYPTTVSQDSTAREIFTLLGYFPKWYRSSEVNVVFKYTGEDKNVTSVNKTITLPLWTQIKDSDGDYCYTLINKPTINMNGEVSSAYTAIEGYVKELSVNGNSVVNISNLDENNRIYIPDYTVAQNGIFISNVDNDSQPTTAWWTEVENLSTQQLSQNIYSFGVDPINDQCYIEFPEDIAALIDKGLSIHYIISSGSQGSVPVGLLDTQYATNITGTVTGDATTPTITLNSDNLEISNTSTIVDGHDPETIDECYRNYKKIVGTFDTLVTLRDYTNAVYNTGLVSNGFVTDRTNDIQDVYKIVTQETDLTNYTTIIRKKTDQKLDSLSAFDLKIYALNYKSRYNSKSDYDSTFTLFQDRDPNALGSNLWGITQLLNSNKCLSHDFMGIESDRMCLVKNKYSISCKIVPTSTLSQMQQISVKQNILQVLFNKLNAHEVDFGDSITYDYLYKILSSADDRIKNIILDTPTLDTYVVYFDSTDNKWKEICISDEHSDYITGYLNADDNLFYSNLAIVPVTIVDAAHQDKVTIATNTFREAVGSDATHIYTFIYSEGAWHEVVNNQVLDPISLETYGITYSGTPVEDETFTVSYTVQKAYTNVFGAYLLNSTYTYMDLTTNYIYTYDGSFKLYSTKRNEFRKEIVAKSVLAGVTPYLLNDGPAYKYQVNQNGSVSHEVQRLTTNAKISIGLGVSPSSVTLHDNETIQFYRPTLTDVMTYGAYVKYEFVSDANTSITANSNYKLKYSERISFLYKESDEEEVYHYVSYGAGTIISPTFTLSPTSQSTMFGNRLTNSDNSYLSASMSAAVETSTSIATLSASKSIVIKDINKTRLSSPVNYIYFVTEHTVTNAEGESYYKLDFDTDGNYILKSNEFFIHTNVAKSSLEILGAGTLIHKVGLDTNIVWQCKAINSSLIAQYGNSALEQIWLSYSADSDNYLEITEQEFVNVLPGGEVELVLPQGLTVNNNALNGEFNNSGFQVSDDVEAFDIVPPQSMSMVATENFSDFLSSGHGYNYGVYKAGATKRDLNVTLELTAIKKSWKPGDILDGSTAGFAYKSDTVLGGSYGANELFARVNLDNPTLASQISDEGATLIFTLKDAVWTLSLLKGEETTALLFSGNSIAPYGIISTVEIPAEAIIKIPITLLTADTLVYQFVNYEGLLNCIDVLGTSTTSLGHYITLTSGTIVEGNVVIIEYTYKPKESVTLSGFTVNYVEPDGTSGTLSSNITEELSWKGRSFLSIDCSPVKPERIYGNQFVSGYVNEQEVIFFNYDSEDNGYICASEAVYTDGGTNMSMALLGVDGDIYYPDFYTYKLISGNDIEVSGENSSTAFNATTGEITLTLGGYAENTVSGSIIDKFTYKGFKLPEGKYALSLVNKCTDIKSLKMSIVDATDASQEIILKTFEGRTDFNATQVHYVLIDISEELATILQNADYNFVISVIRPITENTAPVANETLTINSLLRFVYSDYCTQFKDFATYINSLTSESSVQFNYTYRVPDYQLINNPLASETFYSAYHVYNQFMIPQLSTVDAKVVE